MSNKDAICQAIRERRLLQFYYNGGMRVVEPHQLAYNEKEHVILSAYWIRGYSESRDTARRWREYFTDEISSVIVLDETFAGPRPGYKRTPNEKYHSAICEL